MDGTCGIRVDNPANVIFLPPQDRDDAAAAPGGAPGASAAADPDTLRERGNAAYKCVPGPDSCVRSCFCQHNAQLRGIIAALQLRSLQLAPVPAC